MSTIRWLFVPFLVLGWCTAFAAEPIGEVTELEGMALLGRAGGEVTAVAGAPIFLDDLIRTGTRSRVALTFADGTDLVIGADTEFLVDEFAYRPDAGQLSFVGRLGKGTLHTVTGAIAKIQPQAVRFVTPVGTLGVRGTEFTVYASLADAVAAAGAEPVYFRVVQGSITFSNSAGTVVFAAGEYGVISGSSALPTAIPAAQLPAGAAAAMGQVAPLTGAALGTGAAAGVSATTVGIAAAVAATLSVIANESAASHHSAATHH